MKSRSSGRTPTARGNTHRASASCGQIKRLFLDDHGRVVLRSGRGFRVWRRSLCASSSDSRRPSARRADSEALGLQTLDGMTAETLDPLAEIRSVLERTVRCAFVENGLRL